jgi:hypothetical protein
MLDCQSWVQRSKNVSIVVDCSTVSTDILRLTTIFKYPDGSHVDLFLKHDSQHMFDSFVLSDLGETTGYLLELNIRPWKTQKRKRVISQICATLGVEQDGGELKISLSHHELDDWGDALMRLAQACIRVSDIALTYTSRIVSAFRDDVEEFLESTGYRYETDRMVPGKFGPEVRIDFSVTGAHAEYLLQTLTAANTVVARHTSDDLFTKWYDIPHMRSAAQFVTVLDASSNVFAVPDIRRLQEVSTVIGFPDEQDLLRHTLAA